MAARNKDFYRIIDANFNRAKEGLRVCEDISRYFWDQKVLTRNFKDLRHRLTILVFSLGIDQIIKARDVAADVGRASSEIELQRKNIEAVFGANIQRVKESLRVLEEIAKIIDPKISEGIKKLRYQVYVLEQKAFKRS